MHPNKAFRSATKEDNLAYARDRGFGALTVSSPAGPLAAFIPFILSEDGETFGAHMVRSNPILGVLDSPQPALMMIWGPDAYVSPDWYGVADQVPTWNYVAVHLRGTLSRLPDDQLRPHLRCLSDQFEQRLAPKPVWTLDKVAPDALSRLERMIMPVEFTVESVDGTWKLAQNKPDAARTRAADELAKAGHDKAGLGMMASELAELMRSVA